ncbi:CHAD domain-containing protein [Billgrantia gudaonensis]|uniref:Phosphohistidine phosphatase n=1 Tax=Billgrantia gudaonensis TaxID=376427 RepID=A0A1G8N7R8_9GAMM|nr:CHAD domain-containing protein [Halomonas gudaonensis]SDI76234.1 phosphohistidine phosphatase [Halomonas gudaonensis]
MKHLYLIRHAKARQADRDQADRERPLRRRGHRQLAAMAHPLERIGAFDGALYVSSATRARQTLLGLAVALPTQDLTKRAHHSDDLYTFDARQLRRWLQESAPEDAALTLIGHNPALLALAQWLAQASPERLPTAGALHLALPVDRWEQLGKHCGTLVASLAPTEVSHALFKGSAPDAPALKGLSLAERVHGRLVHHYQRIRALEPGVKAGWDPEFLHQYRVNLRRSRAIAESLLSITPKPKVKKALEGVKRSARATSRLRDLDVFLMGLEGKPEGERGAIEPAVAAWLREQAEAEHRALCQRMASRRYRKQLRRWRDALDAKPMRNLLDTLEPDAIEQVLTERMARHDAQWRALDDTAPDEAIHTLRKTVKRVRYLAELAPDRHRDLLDRLPTRQTLLGDFQDIASQRGLLAEFREAPATASLSPQTDDALTAWDRALSDRMAELRSRILALPPLTEAPAASA